MSGDIPISKDEFKIALEVQAKATEQMVIIAGALKDISVELREVHDRLSNGAIKDIVQGVSDNYNHVHKETIATLGRIEDCQQKFPVIVEGVVTNSSISRDVNHVKWFVGIVGVVIIVATLILRLLGVGMPNLEKNEKTLMQMLETHIQQTTNK
jgi:hypothetical protein